MFIVGLGSIYEDDNPFIGRADISMSYAILYELAQGIEKRKNVQDNNS